MVHLWHTRRQAEQEAQLVAAGVGATGNIVVAVEDGDALTCELVRLACLMAKKAGRTVHLLHVIEVPRSLPLRAVLTEASERADRVLARVLTIAEGVGCVAHCEVVQARDAANAIVDEVREHNYALLLIGLVRKNTPQRTPRSQTVPYVLSHVSCRVWLIQETPDH